MFERIQNKRIIIPVYLEDIVEKLNEATDHWEQYLNVTTGRFVSLSDGAYYDVDEALVELIEASDCFYRLPNQHDIHEYRIMETFTADITDSTMKSRLIQALNGKRPYYHFKNEIRYLGLDKAYYAFRNSAFMDIARKWCVDNQLPFKLRSELL